MEQAQCKLATPLNVNSARRATVTGHVHHLDTVIGALGREASGPAASIEDGYMPYNSRNL